MNAIHGDVHPSHYYLNALQVSLRIYFLLLLLQRHMFCCPTVCHICTGRQVNCRNLGLTTVPRNLPNTTSLIYLNGNNITHIRANEFSELEKLSVLYLDNSNVCYISPAAFAPLKKLYYLYLGDNSIKLLHPGAFEGLSDLSILHLQNNSIEFLPQGLFSQLKAVRYLSLQRNHLCAVNNDTFLGLISLRALNLSNNNISQISGSAFRHLEGLENLYLEGNHLKQVPSKALESLKHLKRLSLSNNPLGTLHKSAFKGLDSLQYLFLVNSNIQAIQDESFYGISNLKQLILSQNELETLNSKTFTYLNHLMYLQLDRNGIGTISDNTFEEMGASLKVLNLAFNNLTFLGPKVLQPLVSLTHFQANFNPWDCGCAVLGIRNFLLSSSFTFSIHCQNPSRLRGRPMRNIKLTEFEDCLTTNASPETKAHELTTGAINSHMKSATYTWWSDASSVSEEGIFTPTATTFSDLTSHEIPPNTTNLALDNMEIPEELTPVNLTRDVGSQLPPAIITVSLKPIVICQQQVEKANQSFHILLVFFVLSCAVIIFLSVTIIQLKRKLLTPENQVDNVLEYYSCYQSGRYQMTDPIRIAPPNLPQGHEVNLIRPFKQPTPEIQTQVILFEHSVL
ncbi:leucine-rich repeat-containing protein 70 [Pelodytes ibericus]